MCAAPSRKLPPTPIERAPRPALGTEPIPKERYTSPAFAEREWGQLWTRAWLLAGFERHSRMLLKLAVASPRHPEHGKITRTIRDSFLATAGIDPTTFSGGAKDVRPAIARAVRDVQGPAMGADFSELRDEQLVDDFHYTIFPNVTLNLFGRTAWLFRHRPHATDPNKMLSVSYTHLTLPTTPYV